MLLHRLLSFEPDYISEAQFLSQQDSKPEWARECSSVMSVVVEHSQVPGFPQNASQMSHQDTFVFYLYGEMTSGSLGSCQLTLLGALHQLARKRYCDAGLQVVGLQGDIIKDTYIEDLTSHLYMSL